MAVEAWDVSPLALLLGLVAGIAFVAASRAVLDWIGLGDPLDLAAPPPAAPAAAAGSAETRQSGGAREGGAGLRARKGGEPVAAGQPKTASEAGTGQRGNRSRMLLFVLVFTLHSFTEGVGLGVSFGGSVGLGPFMSLAIALHNVPEGLAIALVMVQQGKSALEAMAWAIFSSVPQAVMALPAFVFVDAFAPVLPVGLGLAAGAMVMMCWTELLPEAWDEVRGRGEQALLLAIIVVALGATSGFEVMLHPPPPP